MDLALGRVAGDVVVVKIRLPDHHIGRRVVDGGNAVPDQHAVVVGVGHHHVNAVGRHRGGQTQGGAEWPRDSRSWW